MKRPGGRRPGNSETRQAILSTARESFARYGYAGTTIRAVATAAEVDPALVMHFFKTKDELFAACLSFPPDVLARMPAAFEGDPARIGERLTRTYFSLWEEPETGMALRAMLSSAVSHESAAQLLRGFLGAALLAPQRSTFQQTHLIFASLWPPPSSQGSLWHGTSCRLKRWSKSNSTH